MLSLSSLWQLQTTQHAGTTFALELHTSILMPSEQYLCTYTLLRYGLLSASQFPAQQVKKAFKRAVQSFQCSSNWTSHSEAVVIQMGPCGWLICL